MMLKLGRASDLATAAGNMAHFYPELSDSHMLKAVYQESTGNQAAAVLAYTLALDAGLPICADGLTQIYDAVRRHEIQHRRAALLNKVFENRMQSLLWTAHSNM